MLGQKSRPFEKVSVSIKTVMKYPSKHSSSEYAGPMQSMPTLVDYIHTAFNIADNDVEFSSL